MSVFGFEWDGHEAVGTGFPELPPGQYVFEIKDASPGVETDTSGKPYFQLQLEVMEDITHNGKHVGMRRGEYCSLDSERGPSGFARIQFTKGLLEDMGREDVLRPDKGPQDLIGHVFKAAIRKKGDYLNLVGAEPFDGPVEATREDPAPAPQAAQPAPRRTGARR